MKRDFFQVRVGAGVSFFKDHIIKKWNFEDYHSLKDPAVFIGVYDVMDIATIRLHRGPKIIMFAGADIVNYGGLWRNAPNTFHVSYGPYKKILESKGVKVTSHVTPLKNFDFWKPVPLGDKIYVYKGAISERPTHYMWEEIVEPLIKEFGDRVIWTKNMPEQQLRDDFYSKCFAYVKPNPTAGSTTMWEMGHMGIRTFTQDHEDLNFDHTVNYADVDDLIKKLKEESYWIGSTRENVAQSTKNSLDDNENWLSLDYYENNDSN